MSFRGSPHSPTLYTLHFTPYTHSVSTRYLLEAGSVGWCCFLLSSKKTLLVGIFFYNATIYIFLLFSIKNCLSQK